MAMTPPVLGTLLERWRKEWIAHKPMCAVMGQDHRFGWRDGDEAICDCGLVDEWKNLEAALATLPQLPKLPVYLRTAPGKVAHTASAEFYLKADVEAALATLPQQDDIEKLRVELDWWKEKMRQAVNEGGSLLAERDALQRLLADYQAACASDEEDK
jgi:hypothetical protein